MKKYLKKIIRDNRGELLLEALIIIGVIAIVGAISSQVIIVSLDANRRSADRATVEGLIEEEFGAVEAAAFEKWQNLYDLNKLSAHYYAIKQSGAWTITGGDEALSVNGIDYSRYFTVSDVCRDNTTRAIITTAGVPPCTAGNSDDPSTQQVTVSVGSAALATTTRSTYLSRWRNQICAQTSWSGTGSGTTTCPATTYQSGDASLDLTAPGSIKLDPL